MRIKHPAEWGATQIAATGQVLLSTGHALLHTDVDPSLAPIQVRPIAYADLGDALRKGWDDFLAFRDDVVFLCFFYPLAGLTLAYLLSSSGLLPLIFPVFAGFVLIGPFAAVWLYEMSRRREQGDAVSWADAARIFASSNAAAIFKLGLLLAAVFALWLATAMLVYDHTLGPKMPVSLAAFGHDILHSTAGWRLVGFGLGAGLIFALVVLAVGVVSFPLLLDRRVGVLTAIAASVRAMRASPGPILAWGVIVAASLAVAMAPLLIGLIIVFPVLGHATWHLYRKVVA
ncbi:DUF2189 domain-containing protein [Rhodoblastus sp.]|uniref:DUF2189 domain-containing protein n=1 Tax=Rhodoblastus sp. TaxID=1962975 RepID=UPI0035B03FFC